MKKSILAVSLYFLLSLTCLFTTSSSAAASVTSDAAARANFIDNADAICTKGRAQSSELGARPLSTRKYKIWLKKVIAIDSADISKLKALTPPSADVRGVQSIWALFEAGVNAAKKYLTSNAKTEGTSRSEMKADFTNAISAATNYGFAVCGRSTQDNGYSSPPGITDVPLDSNTLIPFYQTIYPLAKYRTGDGKFSKALPNVKFADVGSIPVAISLILSGFNISKDPAQVANDIAKSGAWSSTGGGNWGAIASYIQSQSLQGHSPIQVSNQSVSGMAAQYQPSSGAPIPALYLVDITRKGGTDTNPLDNYILLVTGYEAKSDEFEYIDPRHGGQSKIGFHQIVQGNPLVLQIVQPVSVN